MKVTLRPTTPLPQAELTRSQPPLYDNGPLHQTNTKANIVRLIGVYSSPSSQTYNYKDRTVQYITSYFEARLTETVCPNFSNSETRELKFFNPENIPDDLALINSNWLTDALSKREIAFIR